MNFVDLREFIAPTQGDLPGDEVDIFTDINLIPFDGSDGSEDGDDSVHQESHSLSAPRAFLSSSQPENVAAPKRKLIPFNRILKVGSHGKDVYAVKRALVAAGVRGPHMRNTLLFGQILKKNIKEFQHRQGLRVDGQYGKETHAKLVRYFDKYSEYLYLHSPKKPSVSSVRQKISATAIFGYNHRGSIWYTQGPMRMQGVRQHLRPPDYPKYADCSAYATWCYWAAGAPDPNGPKFNYNGFGYTGTLATYGKQTWNPQIGDLALYGFSWPYHHVTIVIGNGRCISMGSSVGPLLEAVRYRPDLNQYRTYIYEKR